VKSGLCITQSFAPSYGNLVEEAECLDLCTRISIYLLSARIA
jgi:hypothetical protein